MSGSEIAYEVGKSAYEDGTTFLFTYCASSCSPFVPFLNSTSSSSRTTFRSPSPRTSHLFRTNSSYNWYPKCRTASGIDCTTRRRAP
eukprot:2383005-Rhodomonas_salina.1